MFIISRFCSISLTHTHPHTNTYVLAYFTCSSSYEFHIVIIPVGKDSEQQPEISQPARDEDKFQIHVSLG